MSKLCINCEHYREEGPLLTQQLCYFNKELSLVTGVEVGIDAVSMRYGGLSSERGFCGEEAVYFKEKVVVESNPLLSVLEAWVSEQGVAFTLDEAIDNGLRVDPVKVTRLLMQQVDMLLIEQLHCAKIWKRLPYQKNSCHVYFLPGALECPHCGATYANGAITFSNDKKRASCWVCETRFDVR